MAFRPYLTCPNFDWCDSRCFQKANRWDYNFVVLSFCRFRSYLGRIWCWSWTKKAGRKEKLLQKHGSCAMEKGKLMWECLIHNFWGFTCDGELFFMWGRQKGISIAFSMQKLPYFIQDWSYGVGYKWEVQQATTHPLLHIQFLHLFLLPSRELVSFPVSLSVSFPANREVEKYRSQYGNRFTLYFREVVTF